jgi:heme ABC exporter ATP-binding subunit CcmA
MGSAIHLRSAVALLGRFPALAGVDLDVSPGELVLVEGPNGAGKTSLLRVCAGLLPLSAGAGTVLGHDLSRRGRPRGVGFLGHATGLYDDLTALENVEFRARLWRTPPSEAATALERVGLDGPLQAVSVAKLSAGQRRRVGIAALIVGRPRLCLLDEPHAGLDAAARHQLDAVLQELAAAGAAVLLASHETEQVARIVTRSVRIERGRLGGAISLAAGHPNPAAVEPEHVA